MDSRDERVDNKTVILVNGYIESNVVTLVTGTSCDGKIYSRVVSLVTGGQ